MERDSRNTTDEREHGHQGCHGGIGDGRLAYETNNRAAKMIGVWLLWNDGPVDGVGGAGPDRCGIANSDQNLLRDRWLGVVQWRLPFARSSAFRSVPCNL